MAAPVALFLIVLATAVLAVSAFLGSRPGRASLSCVAALPDGTSHALSAEQADNAALIAAVAGRRELPARAVTIALATALQESKLENIAHGDRDSVGLFQQRPSQGWGSVEQIMDPVYAANAFLDALARVEGYESLEITEAAQLVQRSAFPEAYAQHEATARAFASALGGHSPAALSCDLPRLDAQPAGLAEAVAARLERDWGAAAAATAEQAADGVTVAVAAPAVAPGTASEVAAWAVAHWAVATADATGVSQVRIGGWLWARGGAGWQGTEQAQPAGAVLLR